MDLQCALRLSQILPRMRPRMNHPLGIRSSPQPDFACRGCGTRLSNKIHAAGSTNPLIWTALTLSRPFGTQFVSRALTQTLKPNLLQFVYGRSGRTMARTGLRMMPTFPSSPLKFRTAGFPRYGFKAGLSKGAFPQAAPTCRALSVCVLPSCPPLAAFGSPLCVEERHALRHCHASGRAALPQGSSLQRSYSVPRHHRLFDPIRPTRGHSAISLLSNLYALPSLCVSA